MSSLFLLTLFVSVALTSCSNDKDDEPDSTGKSSIVGTWYQVNSSGTTITLVFNSNNTGLIKYEFTNGNASTEPMEYRVRMDSDQNILLYISADSQLNGEYIAYVTPNTLTLVGYVNGSYGEYPFTRKK